MMPANTEEGAVALMRTAPAVSDTYVAVPQAQLLGLMLQVPTHTDESAEFLSAWQGGSEQFALTVKVHMAHWQSEYPLFLTAENSSTGNRAIKFWGGVLDRHGTCVVLYKDPIIRKHKGTPPARRVVEDAYDCLHFMSRDKFAGQIAALKAHKLTEPEVGLCVIRSCRRLSDDRARVSWSVMGKAFRRYLRGKGRRKWDLLRAFCHACQRHPAPHVELLDCQAKFSAMLQEAT
jgi:hypothetical protein